MKAVLIAIALGLTLAATPARADERADLVKEITTTMNAAREPQLAQAIPMLMRQMGADTANLTADEKTQLQAGLEKTMKEVLVNVMSVQLNDPAKFTIDDLRQIRGFLVTPAGTKWNTASSAFDTKDPKMMQIVLSSMLKNIDVGIITKLAMAAAAQKSTGAP